jgi:transposase
MRRRDGIQHGANCETLMRPCEKLGPFVGEYLETFNRRKIGSELHANPREEFPKVPARDTKIIVDFGRVLDLRTIHDSDLGDAFEHPLAGQGDGRKCHRFTVAQYAEHEGRPWSAPATPRCTAIIRDRHDHRNRADGVDGPRRHRKLCQSGVVSNQAREPSVKNASTIGLDLAKNVFQVHGADETGAVVFRKKLRRDKLLAFFAEQPPCVVAMEACASSHHWAREIAKLGHTTRMIAAHYVKPFVKRQKNDAADAEAICEAAQRPSMRFVGVKTEDEQASAMVFRARDLLVRQRTQIINALRGHLTEYGMIAPSGAAHVARVVSLATDPELFAPDAAKTILVMLVEQLHSAEKRIAKLDREITLRAKRDERARRLMTIPGIGPVTAVAITALAAPPETFRKGRDFAAWVGLTPSQHSTGGKQRLGRISKMGERTLRRLLIIGAAAIVRWAVRGRGPANPWLKSMLARKPRMVVTVALANKMARMVWALMAHGGIYRAQAAAA